MRKKHKASGRLSLTKRNFRKKKEKEEDVYQFTNNERINILLPPSTKHLNVVIQAIIIKNHVVFIQFTTITTTKY